eukprot:53619_1
MRIIFILTIAVILPTLTFAGNCECDECRDECRCGNNSSSQQCKDCVTSCEPTNDDCANISLILFIITPVVWICGFCGLWMKRNEQVTDNCSCVCIIKYVCKTLIFLSMFGGGISGLIYFTSCDCDDPWGCREYIGKLTCPSFGGGKCEWDGNKCNNTTCVCCKMDVTLIVVKVFCWIAGVEAGVGPLSIVVKVFQCYCARVANKVKQDKDNVSNMNHYVEMSEAV